LQLLLQADYQKRVDPNDKQAQNLLDEMRAHIKKVRNILALQPAYGTLMLLCMKRRGLNRSRFIQKPKG